MTDASSTPLPGAASRTDAAQAGALLRAARQQQGLHIAALAASIKVTPAKLEALEAGRVDELPDATFTRALAKTVCRVLKTDPAPVLALLPHLAEAPHRGLERVDGGLNAPFRERSSRDEPAVWLPWRHPVLWIVVLLLAAAAAFVLVPTQPGQPSADAKVEAAPAPVMPPSGAGAAPAGEPAAVPGDAASAATAERVVPTAVGAVSATTAQSPTTAASAAPAVPGNTGPAPTTSPPAATSAAVTAPSAVSTADAPLVLRAVEATWVQVVDGTGQTLMARLVPAGEAVALSPALPVKLRIGNAKGTELLFRGQPVNLGATRDNIANLTLP